jgi:hypothetical protein
MESRISIWMSDRSRACTLLLVVALLCAGRNLARADTEEVKPWSQGISRETRAQARDIFMEGNRLMAIPLFAPAAEKFEEALALWPHPAIHYNLAIAQLNLLQQVAAYENLKKAIAHGAGPLGKDEYRQAMEYYRRLQTQLGFVDLRCDDEGAEVRLDGKLVLTGPGSHEAVLMPGSHQIVASKPGYVPEAREIVISPGERIDVSMRLRLPERVETERYMPAWAPWAGMGVGVALLSTGAYFDWRSSADLVRYKEDFSAQCPFGCADVEAPELSDRGREIERGKRTAVGLYIAGSAVLVGSAIMIYVNRERVVRSKVRSFSSALTPMWSPHAAGLALTGDF